MNTSIQIKTHTNHSASIRNVENLRESEQFKNPHIEILKHTPDYKFEDDVVQVPRADAKSEKQRQDELRKVNNKINTYSKRLEVFKAQNNTKKVESLTSTIEDLKQQKEHLQEVKLAPETRGKKREKNYVELIFSLTKSNQWIENAEMQSVLKRAFERMKKTKIIKQLDGITGAMHLDQHSLHIHYIGKIPNGKTWDEIIKEGFENNPDKTDKENAKAKRAFSAKVYKNIQNTFLKFTKEEIWMSNLKNKGSLTAFTHSKGKKYIPLKKYKALNPLENKKVEEIIEKDFEELVEAPKASFASKLNLIKSDVLQNAEKVEESTSKQQKENKNHLDQLVENLEAPIGIESDSSNLEKSKKGLDYLNKLVKDLEIGTGSQERSSNLEEKKEVEEEEIKGKIRRDR